MEISDIIIGGEGSPICEKENSGIYLLFFKFKLLFYNIFLLPDKHYFFLLQTMY